MNRPTSKTTRSILVGLATSLVIVLTPGADAAATEIASDFAERAATEPLITVPPSNVPPADLAQWARATSPFAAEGRPSDELASDVEGGTDAADTPGTISLTMWLPAIISLPPVDALMVDPSLLAVAAIRSSGAARLVCNTAWGLQDPDLSAIEIGLPPLVGNLTERDSLAAAEVAFVLGNVKAPDSDIVFLAFVAIQSLWGLVCRPRQTCPVAAHR